MKQDVESCTLFTEYPEVEQSINFFGDDLSKVLDLDDDSEEDKLGFWQGLVGKKLEEMDVDCQQAHELVQSLDGEVVTWGDKINLMPTYTKSVKDSILQILTTLHASTNHLSPIFDRARKFLLPKPLIVTEMLNGRLLSLLKTQESVSFDHQIACLQSGFFLKSSESGFTAEQDESVDHMPIMARFFYPGMSDSDLNNSRYLYYQDSGCEMLGIYWSNGDLDCDNVVHYKVAADVLGFGDISFSSLIDEHRLVPFGLCSHRAVTTLIAIPDSAVVRVAGSIPQIIDAKPEPVRSTILNAIKARKLDANQVGELLTICHEQEGVALNLAELEGGGGSSM